MLAEFLVAIFTFLVFLTFINRKPKNYPPGPFSWPIVGNIFQLGIEPYKSLMKMKGKYADIMSIKMGPMSAVVLNDAKIIKEALSLNGLSGRMRIRHTLAPKSQEIRGVIMTDGSDWVEQRRFILKNLRDFGFGRKSMELLVQDEVTDLIDGFQKLDGAPISTHTSFNIAVINALWTITAGERFKHDDPKISELIGYITKYVSKNYILIIFFPWSIDIAPKWSGYDEVMSRLLPIYSFLQESIDSHKKSYQEGVKRDLIDCYLDAISKATGSSSFDGEKGDEHMLFGLFDLFLAVYRLQRLVMLETLRYSALVPLGVAHTALEDVELQGYTIPKGTVIMPNQFGVMHDPETWGDADNFRPERFLSEDEQSIIRHDAFIPFSAGKRVCLGESLARDKLFLFSTGLFQRFRVDFDPNSPKPELGHSVNTAVLMPKTHKVVLYDRYQ